MPLSGMAAELAANPLATPFMPYVIAAIAAALALSVMFLLALRRRREMSSEQPHTAAGGTGAVPNSATIERDMYRMYDDLRAARENVVALSASMPQSSQIEDMRKTLDCLCTDFVSLSNDVNGKMEAFKRSSAEDLNKMRLTMEKAALEEIVAKASALLDENGVPRAEFDALRERFDRVHGADESDERMVVLSRLFESDRLKVLNWQCKLIRLLKGGLAPDAEQDLIVSEGIPESACKKFLKRLVDHGIAESKSVRSYYLGDEYEWIYTYTDRPDWLHRRLQGTARKESDYNRYMRTNAELIEDGLIVEATEYALDTGRLDLVCRDAVGRTVGIELKYPAAAVRDKRQVASYRDDYRRRSGMAESRFMLVAPRIPDELKRLLEQDGIEYREVPMAAEDAGAGAGGEQK